VQVWACAAGVLAIRLQWWPAAGFALILLGGTGVLTDLALALLASRRQHFRRRWNRPVLPGAVSWRELFTRAHSGMGVVGWWLVGAWAVYVFEIWWLVPGNPYLRKPHVDLPEALMAIGILMTALSATASIVEERSAGTLELLLASPLRSWRIIAGKVVAVGARTLPFLVAGAALRDPSFALWMVPFFGAVCLAAMTVALALRSPRLAYALNVVVVFSYAIAMAQVPLWPGGDVVRRIGALPLAEDAPVGLGELLVASSGFAALSVVLFAVLAWRFRRWARPA